MQTAEAAKPAVEEIARKAADALAAFNADMIALKRAPDADIEALQKEIERAHHWLDGDDRLVTWIVHHFSQKGRSWLSDFLIEVENEAKNHSFIDDEE